MSEPPNQHQRRKQPDAKRDQTKVRVSRTLARPVSGATRIGRRSAAGPGATFGILAGFMVAGAVGAALLSVHLHQVSGANSPSPYGRATHAVIFVVDGAGSQSLPLDRMPNLSGLAHTGTTYSNAWVGQMMATPAASGATIATGVFPRKHGVVADQWLDPRSHQIVRPTSGDAVLVGSLDAVMEPRGVTPIASVIKSRMPRSRVLSVGGTNCAAAAAAGTWVADYIVCAARRARNWVPVTVAGHALPSGAAGALNLRAPVTSRGGIAPTIEGWSLGAQDRWVSREVVQAMRATRPALTIVSFPELAIVDQYAPPSNRNAMVSQLTASLDRDIGEIVRETEREKIYSRTVFVVTSGRAMSAITSSVPTQRLSSAVVAAGGEPQYISGDLTASIGLRDALQAQPVAQSLESGTGRAIDAVYFKSQTASGWQYGAQYVSPGVSSRFADATQYLLGTVASADSPDVVVIYRPHAGLILERAGRYRRREGGLGLQWDNQHIPLIVAGHGTYAGRTSSYPARLVDIAPTVEALLGLSAGTGDGEALRDGLIQPPAGADFQKASSSRLRTLTTALQNRARRAGS